MATRTAQANTFSTDTLLVSTGGIAYDFGFVANYIRVENVSGSPIRINLSSTTSSTDGDAVYGGETREWFVSEVSRIGLTTTSTTTSTGDLAVRRNARVFASG